MVTSIWNYHYIFVKYADFCKVLMSNHKLQSDILFHIHSNNAKI
jgi:hypothetical protein